MGSSQSSKICDRDGRPLTFPLSHASALSPPNAGCAHSLYRFKSENPSICESTDCKTVHQLCQQSFSNAEDVDRCVVANTADPLPPSLEELNHNCCDTQSALPKCSHITEDTTPRCTAEEGGPVDPDIEDAQCASHASDYLSSH